jgi:hypothetical protein
MDLHIDPDLKAVAEFMQGHVPASKLVHIAQNLSALAPLLWGAYQTEQVTALCLRLSAISRDGPRTQSDATE